MTNFLKIKREGTDQDLHSNLYKSMKNLKFLIKNTKNILDLGSAPGGWLQVVKKHSNSKCKILGVDILSIEKIENFSFLKGDVFEKKTIEEIIFFFNDPLDIILSDMSPNTSGNRSIDHLKIISLTESVLEIAEKLLKRDGFFICKIFQGGAQGELIKKISNIFKSIKYFKPKASRKESPETYIVGKKK